jgi:hypothetical protein
MLHQMIEETNNPWAKINFSSSKRVDINTFNKFYWIKDEIGRLGLRINIKSIPTDAEPIIKVYGITFIIRINEDIDDEIFLILMNHNDQEIFYALCFDVINSSLKVESEIQLYKTITNRLRNWQRFFELGSNKTMTEQSQMGLFTELAFLNDHILCSIPFDQAILSWVGPDFHKQDFSFDDFLIEIKSYTTSKGPFVKISSMHQLLSDEKQLFLFVFGISKSIFGMSIQIYINLIREKLLGNIKLLDNFEEKLNRYGYFEGITQEPFFKFNIDSKKCYKVTSDFPRIIPSTLAFQITEIQYTIDISKCKIFESKLTSLNFI